MGEARSTDATKIINIVTGPQPPYERNGAEIADRSRATLKAITGNPNITDDQAVKISAGSLQGKPPGGIVGNILAEPFLSKITQNPIATATTDAPDLDEQIARRVYYAELDANNATRIGMAEDRLRRPLNAIERAALMEHGSSPEDLARAAGLVPPERRDPRDPYNTRLLPPVRQRMQPPQRRPRPGRQTGSGQP